MSNPYPWGRYTELRPQQLEALVRERPIAYLPWGALEWHGPHLPFGVDGMLAEAVAERTIQHTGGVLLPTTWWPITTLPHRFSISIPSGTIQALWDSVFSELARAEFRIAVVLSGHYAQGHELVLMDAAEQAIRAHDLLVLALPPLAMVDEQMLDHAARWETAQMLALRPRLVDVGALDGLPYTPKFTAVLGDDPRSATVKQGEAALNLAVERISSSVLSLLEQQNADTLHEFYSRRRAGYQNYVSRYFRGSWEQALANWWKEKND